MDLGDHARMSDVERAALLEQIGALTTLHRVVLWGLAQSPECVVSAVVVQDEFSHDVVMPWRDGRVLVFDTT